ncbi:MAG: extracellular solute-binding protein [Maribacter sp.]|uniref:ABC transporter substrate-binding protein n=1 Tax=Maribacter sp. TaxID=1897614 RepID=UPI003C719415
MQIELKGMAWDHPRGYEPLRALSKEFAKSHPDVSIKWDIRSLKEFGDMPIEDLIADYDLITIDHPYMGQAHKNRLLIDLKEFIANEELAIFESSYVDHCYDSYHYQGHLYALPIDAAALVAAKRDDLLVKLGLEAPTTHDGLHNFYKKTPKGYSVAWALCPTDIWCSFLTLCAQNGGNGFINVDGIDTKIGAVVIDQLKYHLEFLHPESINWNPIQLLDHMANNEEIIYAPYLFGYTNYSRLGYARNLVTFIDSPRNPKMGVSTILGGVGLAVSANCSHKETAVDLLKYIANPENQEGAYVQHQGQPAALRSWQNEANNILCGDFFKNTMSTMRKAYVRPQHPGWNQFQEQGAEIIHKGMIKNREAIVLINELNALYKSIVSHE